MRRILGLLATIAIAFGTSPASAGDLHDYTTTIKNNTGRALNILITSVYYGHEGQCNLIPEISDAPVSDVPCRTETMDHWKVNVSSAYGGARGCTVSIDGLNEHNGFRCTFSQIDPSHVVVTVDDSTPAAGDMQNHVVVNVTNNSVAGLNLIAGHGAISHSDTCARGRVDAHSSVQITCDSVSTDDFDMKANIGQANTKACAVLTNGDNEEWGIRCTLRRIDETHFDFIIDDAN